MFAQEMCDFPSLILAIKVPIEVGFDAFLVNELRCPLASTAVGVIASAAVRPASFLLIPNAERLTFFLSCPSSV